MTHKEIAIRFIETIEDQLKSLDKLGYFKRGNNISGIDGVFLYIKFALEDLNKSSNGGTYEQTL